MGSAFQIKTIKLSNGERRAMLCSRVSGLPLAKPTLYLTTHFCIPGREFNTQKSVLAAIHFLYAWMRQKGLDLEGAFARGMFLSLQQIESLNRDIRCDLRFFLNLSLDVFYEGDTKRRSNYRGYRRYRRRRKIRKEVLNAEGTTAVRIHYIAGYLDWLANETINRTSARKPEHAAMRSAKEEMIKAIKARAPSKGNPTLRRGLSYEERLRFRQVLDPLSPDNPFKSKFVKVRNQIAGELMLTLGSRRAENLLVKLQDIDWSLGGEGPTLDLKDHPMDVEDSRRVRPQFKTKERRHPLGRNIVRLLDAYVKLRKTIPGAACHGYLLVSREGKPLSLSSMDEIFLVLSCVDGLPDNLSAHLLRYTWNDMFSEAADRKIAAGEWTIETEKARRRYLQGWNEDSKMPDLYARRHIERSARAMSLEMQDNLLDELVNSSLLEPSMANQSLS